MSDSPVHRRAVLAGGAGVIASLAGCVSTSATPPNSGGDGGDDSGGDSGNDSGGGSSNVSQLQAGGSSTVYPIASKASSYWNSNPPADDEQYWGPGQYDIDTDQNLADYWSGRYSFESGSEGSPPFGVSVGLSHSGTGLEKLRSKQIDIGNASAPVAAELSDASQDVLDNFVDHVVGIDAQPIVVSRTIYEAGVQKLTADQVRKIYTGEIENWSEIPSYSGPDKPIQAIGRSVGSGTDTSFRTNLLGGPTAKMPDVDVRKGENQQVATLVEKSNNAVAYMAFAFVTDSTPAVTLVVDGKSYKPGESLGESGYPLARDLHMYTWKGTSKKEAAFIRMILSDYGQQNFVVPEGYAKLPDGRQKKQISKLPESGDN